MPNSKWNALHCALFLLLANLTLTAWTSYVKPVINYDGILYINAAQAIQNGNGQLALEFYKGQLYPFLIQFTANITSLNLEHAAHLLNALFLTSISMAFVLIVRQLGGKSNLILIISILLILLFPSITKYRPFIIRDFGFLNCYLWSIYFLLAYYDRNKISDFFLWLLLLGMSAFFRTEGAIFLAGLGTLLLVPYTAKQAQKTSRKSLIILTTSIIFALTALLLLPSLLTTLPPSNPFATALSYPGEYIERALSLLNQKLSTNHDQSNGLFFTIFESVGNVIYEILKRLEIIYAIFALIAIKFELVLTNKEQRKIISYYILVAVLILILFEISLGYLTSRYALTIALTVLLLATFTLEKAYQQFSKKTRRTQAALVFLALILSTQSLKRLEPSEQHVEASTGKWIEQNLSTSDIIASNNSKVLYYAKRYPYIYFADQQKHHRYNTQLLLSKRNESAFSKADYLAFMVRIKSPNDLEKDELFKAQYGPAIKRFEQDEGLYVHVYEIK